MKLDTTRPSPGDEPRAVGVEDAGDAHVDAVRAVHGHGEALGEPLGLVVDAARPGRVDVAPVGLDLGVHLGVAVDLARARHEEPGVVRSGQLEQAARALAADGQRVEGPGEVRRRRRRDGQVAHGIDLGPVRELHLLAHVADHEAELRSCPAGAPRSPASPVERSSRQTTESPRAIRRSHRCEPRKPAPPATTTRLTGARSPSSGNPCVAPPPGRAGCGRRRWRARP